MLVGLRSKAWLEGSGFNSATPGEAAAARSPSSSPTLHLVMSSRLLEIILLLIVRSLQVFARKCACRTNAAADDVKSTNPEHHGQRAPGFQSCPRWPSY